MRQMDDRHQLLTDGGNNQCCSTAHGRNVLLTLLFHHLRAGVATPEALPGHAPGPVIVALQQPAMGFEDDLVASSVSPERGALGRSEHARADARKRKHY